MPPSRRNHYNPCFWTALWNPDYYTRFRDGSSDDLEARRQTVHTLNVRANKIYKSAVGNVHYDKNLGVAEITKEGAVNFYDKHHPDGDNEFRSSLLEAEYPVYIDFEQMLTLMEELEAYKVLLEVARRNSIATAYEKIQTGLFPLSSVAEESFHSPLSPGVEEGAW